MHFVNQVGNVIIFFPSRCGGFTRNLQKLRLLWKNDFWMHYQVSGNLHAVQEAHTQIWALPPSERTELENCSDHDRMRNQMQSFHIGATRLKMEQTLLEADLRLITHKALVLFPKATMKSCFVPKTSGKFEIGHTMELPSSGQVETENRRLQYMVPNYISLWDNPQLISLSGEICLYASRTEQRQWNCILQTWAKKIIPKCKDSSCSECQRNLT